MKLHELPGIQTFANITNAFLTSNTLSACVHLCFFINLNQSVKLKLDHSSHPTEDTIFSDACKSKYMPKKALSVRGAV